MSPLGFRDLSKIQWQTDAAISFYTFMNMFPCLHHITLANWHIQTEHLKFSVSPASVQAGPCLLL